MLYADEDINERVLVYRCKNCDYQERAEDKNEYENCVYKTDMEAKASALIINPDIVDDPTLQKRIIDRCRNKNQTCNSKEVVTFYHITRDRMHLVYVCIKCRTFWKMEEKDPRYDIADHSDEEK